MSNNTTPEEIKSLTGLRGFAALWVFALHACYGNVNVFGYFPAFNGKLDWGLFKNFILHGHLAVDLFFILSGFILSYVYKQTFSERIEPGQILAFFFKRLARLYPVHAFITLALALTFFTGLWQPLRPLDWQDVFLSLTLTNVLSDPSVNIPAWSISAEWFAYIACPVLLLLNCRCMGPRRALLAAGLVCVLYPVIFLNLLCCSGIAGASAILRVISGFYIGTLLHILYISIPRTKFFEKAADAGGALCLLMIFLLATLDMPFYIIYPFLPVFIFCLAVSRGFFQVVFSSRTMLYLGAISYCVYMVHYPVLEFYSGLLSDWLYADANPSQMLYGLVFMALLGTTLLCAHFCYVLIEKPARKALRDRL